MAFNIRMETKTPSRQPAFSASNGVGRNLTICAAIFAAFCVFDCSPYGGGLVHVALVGGQHWFQGVMGSLHIKT